MYAEAADFKRHIEAKDIELRQCEKVLVQCRIDLETIRSRSNTGNRNNAHYSLLANAVNEAQIRQLEGTLQELNTKKLEAVQQEDYILAGKLKAEIQAIENEIATLQNN
jgi:hypothetical protein